MSNNENIKAYLDIEDVLVCSNAQWPGTVLLEGQLMFPGRLGRHDINYKLHVIGNQQ